MSLVNSSNNKTTLLPHVFPIPLRDSVSFTDSTSNASACFYYPSHYNYPSPVYFCNILLSPSPGQYLHSHFHMRVIQYCFDPISCLYLHAHFQFSLAFGCSSPGFFLAICSRLLPFHVYVLHIIFNLAECYRLLSAPSAPEIANTRTSHTRVRSIWTTSNISKCANR